MSRANTNCVSNLLASFRENRNILVALDLVELESGGRVEASVVG